MSTRRSTTASRKATTKASPPAPTSNADPAESITPVVVSENMAPDAGPELKKQELLDKVVTRTDVKKKFAKPVVEAVLEILGEALAEGRELNLQPLGKVKLNRIKEMANARVIVAKIRQPKAGGASMISGSGEAEEDPMKDQVAQGAE
ncbi:MAG: HU family DNA-binding protein [Roseovarius sp.]|nr:HU family DNA-binding protein [Roseovarius sp.]